MKTRQSLAIVIAIGMLPVVLNCECEETESLILDEARMDRFFIGDSETPPNISSYGETEAGVSPTEGHITVDFGRVDVETVTHKYLMIKNTGTLELNIVGVVWEKEDASFVIGCREEGVFKNCEYSSGSYLSIPANEDLVIKITYTPMEVASHTAEFLIQSNATGFKNVRVDLLGQGVTPEIEVCISNCEGDQASPDCQDASEKCDSDVAPDNLTVRFGEAVAGDEVNRLMIIRNRGQQSLNVQTPQFIPGGDEAQFRWQVTEGEVPGVIATGQEAKLVVTYRPKKGGQHQATLQIISDDVNKREVNVNLNGKGLAPRVCPEPVLLDFGNVTVGEPLEKHFTLTNCGLLDLVVDDVRLNSDSSQDFSLTSLPAFPLTLAPEASVEIHVIYAPSDRGSDHGGVDIYSNDPTSDPDTGRTGTVELRGNGVVKECQIQPIPTSLNFGGVVQQQSDTMILTLSNQGTATCRIDAVEIIQNSADGEFSIVAQPADGTTFDPGDVVMPQVEVKYAPQALGMDNGKLKITGNDADGPEIIVDLIGEGVLTAICDLQVSPTTLRFGTVKLNGTQSMVISLKNEGNAACEVTDYELRDSILLPSDFEITQAPPKPFTVARRGQPGDQVEIEVTFAPSVLDFHKSALWLFCADDPDFLIGDGDPMCIFPPPGPVQGEACIPVTGMSAESDIEVVPAELDFGVVTVGCNSPELRVTVYNLGTMALTVSDIYLENPADPNFEIMYAPSTPYTLNGGGSFEVRLRYHPQDLNPHRNTLYLQSDASNVDLLAVPLFGRGTNISDQVDVFHQPTEVKSDVLFVIDNSGSMMEEQNALASNFSHFIRHTTTLDVDFHIGVVATEVNSAESDLGSPPRDVIPGVLVHPDSRPKVLTNTTPDVEGAFADNVRIGTCCSDEQEAGLEAAWMALSPPLVDDTSATGNGGFLREDAKLYIICVSDEQDQSKGTPDFYVDFFSSIKGYHNTDMMKVSAVCGDCPNGCGGEQAMCGSRYIEVANRTGGIFESICTSNWAQALENLGIDAFAAIREFPLSRPADPSTIVVTVNGVEVPQAGSQGGANGWTYFPDTNSIFFGDNVVPDKGDRIEVHYTAACL